MELRPFGRLGEVGAITLGGGGIGNVWGRVGREEAVSTVRLAVESGVTLLDLAPTYGPGELSPEAELVVADAFGGSVPADVRLTTKVVVADSTPPDAVAASIRASLEGSLERLGREHIDVLFLHSYVRPAALRAEGPELVSSTTVAEFVRPAFERLVAEGLARAWGITAVAHPDAVCDVLNDDPAPAVAQVVINALDAAPDMWPFHSPPALENLRVRTTCESRGVAVMAIRAAAAGALTDRLDRDAPADDPITGLWLRAERFRQLASDAGTSAAMLAHRYALSQPGVATVVLGAKNRTELTECLAAEAQGPLSEAELDEITAVLGHTAEVGS